MLRTREQGRAARTFDQIQSVPPGDRERYGQYAHKLPILIHQAGLAQALTFAHAKGATRLIADLASQLHALTLIPRPDADCLMAEARQADLMTYQRLTREVLGTLVWHKRFAESVLGIDASQEQVAR